MIKTKSAAMPNVFSLAPAVGRGPASGPRDYRAAVQRLAAQSTAPTRPNTANTLRVKNTFSVNVGVEARARLLPARLPTQPGAFS